MMPAMERLETPSLILEHSKMTANVARLTDRLAGHAVRFRPHLKSAKSVDVAKRMVDPTQPMATVSTLREAEVFAEAGIRDILYAVGIAPGKLDRALSIRSRGCDLTLLLDSLDQADTVAAVARRSGDPVPVLIEIDCDGHRGGVVPEDPALLHIAERLRAGGAELRGVLTHAGESYSAQGIAAQAACAERERAAAVRAADRLMAAGFPCPVVSIGSTPTALAAQSFDGVTEVRAGVFAFFDLVMAGIGVCRPSDIALSVLTSVIGHQREKGWILVDAGWMALSRDRGTHSQPIDQGYGLVCDAEGTILPDLIVSAANQEHGVITRRPGTGGAVPDLPVGTRLRILPNHACATAAQYSGYEVLPETPGNPMEHWPRFGGW